ncbi:DUF1289 domain-containing protein [Jiella pelagia]|uniref:DUF1289 domain-containing protein n=1 Tax=Jiella pelagia TaxID=2986949 RepID=A0ABY7C5Z6_9HYPH|nr:DUF1289 domain-containing protein [Jiella pelagia]WAP71123.1 DUF1289 domain-containing protein [Jiella pelagia]
MDAASGLCLGCGRTLEEIAGWAAFSAETRRSIMARLEGSGPARPSRDRDARSQHQDGGRTGSAASNDAS